MEIIDLDLEMTETIVTAQEKISRRKGQEIHLTDDGVTGKGEVLPLPPWSKSTAIETEEELRTIQLNPEQYRRNARIFSLEVQAGMGSASWTQRAASSGEPLWSFLGGKSDRVFVNALIGGGTESMLRRSISEALNKGYGTLKAKMGFSDDQRRLEVIADEITPETRVRLDANGAWTPQEALDLTRSAHKLLGERLEYVEDPVSTIEQLQEIRSNLLVAVASDFLTPTQQAIEQAINQRVITHIVLKPALLGGIEPVLDLSKKADDAGISTVLSSTYDGPVGLHSWCHLAAVTGPDITHGLATAELIDDRRMKALTPRNGVIELQGQ